MNMMKYFLNVQHQFLDIFYLFLFLFLFIISSIFDIISLIKSFDFSSDGPELINICFSPSDKVGGLFLY